MAICGCTSEPRKGKARICLMAKFHEEPHFDVIPFKESPEKFYGSAREYTRQEKRHVSDKREEDKSYEELADEIMAALKI